MHSYWTNISNPFFHVPSVCRKHHITNITRINEGLDKNAFLYFQRWAIIIMHLLNRRKTTSPITFRATHYCVETGGTRVEERPQVVTQGKRGQLLEQVISEKPRV